MTEFTADFLATQAGIVATVMVMTEVLKWLLKIKGEPTFIRAIALVVAVGASLVWLPTLTVHSVFVGTLNGCLCALMAMKGYEIGSPLGSSAAGVVKKLWNAE